MVLQFPLVAMGSALRGTGIVKPTMIVQMLTVLLNARARAGPHRRLGHAPPAWDRRRGAGQHYRRGGRRGAAVAVFRAARALRGAEPAPWRPTRPASARILSIGLPAGGEFLMMFVILAVIYWVIRSFGPAAQAGFGIGGRVMQAVFLPAMALAFGTSPLAGQNYGGGPTHACARRSARRRCSVAC